MLITIVNLNCNTAASLPRALYTCRLVATDQIRCLQLVAAEQKYALAETEIREEVCAEMSTLLHDMEASYKVWHVLNIPPCLACLLPESPS